MKKMLIAVALCASSALAYADASPAQQAGQSASSPTSVEMAAHALPTALMLQLAKADKDAIAGAPRFGEQPVSTKVVGHEDVVVADQKVTLAVTQEKYASGWVSECHQYVKSFEHQIVADSDAWGSASNMPSDETTIKLGNRCGRPQKG